MNCIHLPAGLGHTSANFDINIDSCGTQGNSENGIQGYGIQGSGGSYYENVVVIQYDSQVQEVWDQARKLRCTWHDQYEKSVTFRPFPVDQLDVVRADFAGDNVGCWMQIQVWISKFLENYPVSKKNPQTLPGRQRPMGIRSFRNRQDRPNHDHGPRH